MPRMRTGYRTVRLLLWALTGLGVVQLVAQLVIAANAHFAIDATLRLVHVLLAPILPLIVAPSLVNLVALPAAHRYHLRLEAAWRGDDAQAPLAEHQPVTEASALSLPLTIRLRPRWYVLASAYLLFILVVGLFGLASIFTDTYASDRTVKLVFLSGVLAVFLVAAIAFLLVTQRTDDDSVTVSEEGMTVHSPDALPQMHTIRWTEARLFAISDGRKRRPGVVFYMLAAPGPGKSVSWPRVYRPPQWYSYLEPTVPFAEYDRQMQALLSLIVARTGLPLRDLR